MADKFADIEERICNSLQDSLNELYAIRQEETGHLNNIRERSRSIAFELRNLASAIDKAVSDYERSRAELLDKSKLGNVSDEKFSYERASEFMKMRGSLEERYKMLSEQKNDLSKEERRLERFVTKSENMGNRLRMVLDLFTSPINSQNNFTGENYNNDNINNAEIMLAAFLFAEQESTIFARDLHDGPTQIFSAVGLMLEMAQEYINRSDLEKAKDELERATEQTRNGLNEIRAFLFRINPTGIEDGFNTPLKRLASQLLNISGCKLSYNISGNIDILSANVRIGAFKTLHQAVFNAAYHGATEVKVAISCAQKILRVRITDNGHGFDVKKEKIAAKERGSYGLSNMEDRVKMLGGNLSISSVLKKGSSVSFSIPILNSSLVSN